MRRFLLLVVLVAVLAALVALQRSIADWQHYVVTGEPGALLYAASFDGGGTDGFNSDWSQYGGRLSTALADGRMQVSIGEAGSGAYSVAAPYFSDFDLRVEARAVDGPIDNAYGVVFRLQNEDNASVDDDSYYLFLISSDGYYRVMRSISGQLGIISDWIDSPLINQGLDAANELRVIARGSEFRFLINGEAVSLCIPDDLDATSTYAGGTCYGGSMHETLTDTTIPYGQVGVTAQATPSGGEGVVAAFDNVIVYAPEMN